MKIDTPQKREAVKQFVEDNPSMPSRQMARILFKKNPLLFSSFNAAYCAVRGRRGAQGDTNRKNFKANKHLFQDRTGFQWQLPKSQADTWEHFALPQGVTLSLSDIHVPYHDDNALAAALSYGRTLRDGKGPNNILLNGDTADFFALSRFEKDPRKRDTAGEVMAVRSFLGYLRQEFPKARILFKLGNHDERWEKWLWQKAAELLDLPQMQLPELLTGATPESEKFKAQPAIEGIEFIGEQRPIVGGRLMILHGHEFPKGMSNPVNPARGNFLRGLECSLAGHQHRTSKHRERTMGGRIITCWSQGCLCGLTPEYARINKWEHSFAVVEFKGNDEFHVETLDIIKGKVYG